MLTALALSTTVLNLGLKVKSAPLSLAAIDISLASLENILLF